MKLFALFFLLIFSISTLAQTSIDLEPKTEPENMPEVSSQAPAEPEPTPFVPQPDKYDTGGPTLQVKPAINPNPAQLQQITSSGTRYYNTNPTPLTQSAGFRIVPFNPTRLESEVDGLDYTAIYKRGGLMVAFDYDYFLFQNIGKFAVKGSIGFFAASGQGRFKHAITTQAEEVINFYCVPFSLSGEYRLHFWDRQFVVPYAEAGGDYFGMMEYRPDKKLPDAAKWGGAPAWHWAAGALFQLDALDKRGSWQLDSEYGINHINLIAGVRQIIGLDSTFDFTALVYEGGIMFDF